MRIRPIVWILGLGLLVALVAIFVFSVPVSTVGYYALIAAFIGSHFFMHGSHGGHSGPNHPDQDRGPATGTDGLHANTQTHDEHPKRSGSCH